MRNLFLGIVMTGYLFIWNSAFSQRLEADLSLSAANGYLSNTYLVPYIPEWDRSQVSVYSSISPSAQLRWADSRRSVTVNGTGLFMRLFGDRPAWSGGYFTSMYRQRLTSVISARVTGGMNYYSSSTNPNMQWLQAGAEWLVSPFAKLEASIGTGWRTFTGSEEEEDIRNRYDSYGLGLEYWAGYRWRLMVNFYSGLSHITDPGQGFAGFVSASRFMQNGTMVMLQTGLEQYSQDFQPGQANGGGLPGAPVDGPGSITDNGSIITLEDRFFRTTLSASYPVTSGFSLTGAAAGLLWFSSEDNDILPDYRISAGFQVSFSPKRVRTGELRSLEWKRSENRPAVLTVRYRGNESLYITGDFNDWDHPGIPLQKTGRNRYSTQLDLPVGVHQYKIAVRGNSSLEWLDFPDEVPTVNDGFGSRNGRIIIEYQE